jgi:hypothetical protein
MEVYFSSLFEICNEKKLWLMLPLWTGSLLTDRRWLYEGHQDQLIRTTDQIITCTLGEGRDKPIWNLTKSVFFCKISR